MKILVNTVKSKDIIVLTQKVNLGNYLYKVWRLSPEYDSFLYKLEKNLPSPHSFNLPIEGIYKINDNNTQFDSLEVVNSLNHYLQQESKDIFGLEPHYADVFTEYLHYAKRSTDVLLNERYIKGDKFDFLTNHKVGDSYRSHTYIERKAPLEYENMSEARNQSIRYVSIETWPLNQTTAYGINSLGLNMEFVEYNLGYKGMVFIDKEYEEYVNKRVVIYSIISESDKIDHPLSYSFRKGSYV